MDMLSRYLYAVQQALPESEQRGDIIAEIADALQSRIDEREAQLGRPLTADEEAEIIKAYGYPTIVAGRYAAVPWLIGPDLLPIYWYVLRFTLTIGLTLVVVGGALIAVAARNMEYFADGLYAAWSSLFYIAAVVTVLFAVFERVRANHPFDSALTSSWDPRRLPAPPKPGAPDPVGPFESAAGFICSTIVLLLLLNAQLLLKWLFPVQINVASWMPLYIAAIVATSVLAITNVVAFLQPTITLLRMWVQLGVNVELLAGIGLTLVRAPWFLPANSVLNEVALYTLIVVMAIQGIQIAVALFRLLRHKPGAGRRMSTEC